MVSDHMSDNLGKRYYELFPGVLRVFRKTSVSATPMQIIQGFTVPVTTLLYCMSHRSVEDSGIRLFLLYPLVGQCRTPRQTSFKYPVGHMRISKYEGMGLCRTCM